MQGREVPAGKILETDVCVIGGGAAGIALARELRGSGRESLVLESGGFQFDPAVQRLYAGRTDGTFLPAGGQYLLKSRTRMFGGTTSSWAGWCVPMEAMDFERRDWIPHSGWPLTRADLDPFYIRASSLCQVKPPAEGVAGREGTPRAPLDLGQGSGIATRLVHMSPPTRFGDIYRADLVKAPDVTLCLGSSVVELIAVDSGAALSEVVTATLAGNRFRVRAKAFVLAAGGIENARLLLQSRALNPAGLGNDRDLVGRYFMEHPHLHVGYLAFSRPGIELELYREHSHDPLLGHDSLGLLCPTPELQRRERILNMSVQLYPPRGRVSPHVSGVGRMATQVDAGFDPKAGSEKAAGANLYARVEPSPNPGSRVVLTDERDALGQPGIALDWRLPREDGERLQRTLVAFGRELGRLGRGRIYLRVNEAQPWPEALGGDHHMGTTRMDPDPSRGVVDADCRVHGLGNLFVAGSSVFPSAGYANPTLTLLAMALRLADHLKRGVAS